jgi:tRNA (guanine9-N1)-methyltransferase
VNGSRDSQKKKKMSDIEERPSKIRKVELPEESKSSEGSPLALFNLDENKPEESSGQTKHEANDTQHPESQGVGERAVLSKNQLKKLRKQEQWLAGKEYRRTKRREKHKEKQARKAVAAQEAAHGGTEAPKITPTKENKQHPRRPIQVPIALIMDCDFNELMTEKELISLGAQLTRCYSDNKGSPYRSHLAVSSWGGSLKMRFETVLANHHLNWKGVKFFESDFQAAAEELDAVMRAPEGGKRAGALSGESKASESKSEDYSTEKDVASEAVENLPKEIDQENPAPSIVYLTSDSPNKLDRLSPNTSYIIGGIVDKNRHKGICYKRACERSIPTAKLPIGEYMTMQSRSVLAVNHVVEIMLRWLETGDWGEAFLSVIPKRKEAKLIVNKNGSVEGGENTSERADVDIADDIGDGDQNHEDIVE